MEQLRTVLQNEQTKTLSQSQPTSIESGKNGNGAISPIEHAALFAVINKSRLINGWTTRTAKELDPTIRIWHATFADYGIPREAYDELYKRAFDVRQSKLQSGDVGKVPALDATLLVSQWEGPNGLKSEWKSREIARGRTLTANAETICQMCFGSGFRSTEEGGYLVSRKCDHGNV